MSSTKSHIPSAKPTLRFQKFKGEIQEAFNIVLNEDQLILSPVVQQFESAFAKYNDTDYCITTNSCTDAIILTLMALNIGVGDEVITTGLTAPATIVGILNAGATPIVVDIGSHGYCIDIDEVRKVINHKTKAIIPVHLHGDLAAIDSLVELSDKNNIYLVEDAAQAHGATFNNKKSGSFGIAGVFSFYPTKNLGTIGDGGAVITDDEALYHRLKRLRNYGFDENHEIELTGINSRMDAINAAVLSILLPHLDEYNIQRRANATRYNETLDKTSLTLPKINASHVYHQYVIAHHARNELQSKLQNTGISTGIHYSIAIDGHKAFTQYCQPLPNANKAAKSILSLPIQPEILDIHFDYIIDQLLQINP